MLAQILDILKYKNVFLTGGGGVGKSYTTQAIISAYRNNSKNVVVLGSTGISAVGIGGVSLHSFFKFNITQNLSELRTLDLRQRSQIKKINQILKVCDLIVIDEISMVSSDLMEMIHYRLQNSNFSGRILLVGDFYQLPPVQKLKSSQNLLFNFKYAFSSHAWFSFDLVYIELLVSKRTKDANFYSILSRLRIGTLDNEVIWYLENLKTDRFVLDKNDTVLFGRNNEVVGLNKKMLSMIESELFCVSAILDIYDKNISHDTVSSWVSNLNAPIMLDIKVGAKIIFVTNKWGEYYNGERGEIIDIIHNADNVEYIVVKKDSGNTVNIKRHAFELCEFIESDKEVVQNVRACFSQFPFKLAYAITIHKSQGMSIDGLVCDLNHIFANGQLYVALSRATNPNGLKLVYNKSRDFKDYLYSVVSIDEDVREFYNGNKFVKEIL